jgi:hypothetical protein
MIFFKPSGESAIGAFLSAPIESRPTDCNANNIFREKEKYYIIGWQLTFTASRH